MRLLIVAACLAVAGCVTEPTRPPDAAELYPRGASSRSSADYPAGPAVHVAQIDGRSMRSSERVFLSPGLHRVRLLIVELDVEANPEIEFWAEANHKYEIFAAYHGYTEFYILARDITNRPSVGVFTAVVPKSVSSPPIRYLDGPHRPTTLK